MTTIQAATLFGRKKPSPQDNPYAQQSDNPYAQQSSNDPYSNSGPPSASSYQQGRPGLPGGPRPGGGLPGGPAPRGSYGSPPPPYTGVDRASSGYNSPAGSGYANEKVGALEAMETIDMTTIELPTMLHTLQTREIQATASGKVATVEWETTMLTGTTCSQAPRTESSVNSNLGPMDLTTLTGALALLLARTHTGDYGEQRELTEEEREEQELKAMQNDIKQTNQDAESSLDRSIAMGLGAIETFSGTMARVAAQGERLDNTQRNLNLAYASLLYLTAAQQLDS